MTALEDLKTGDVLRAAWGEYVYRGIPARDGRVPLADLANPTAYVLVAVERLEVDYQHVGRLDVQAPVRGLQHREDPVPVVVSEVPDAHANAPVTLREPCPNAPSSESSSATGPTAPSAVTSTSAPESPTPVFGPPSAITAERSCTLASRPRVPARTTLGALRPPSNSRGTVREELGAGSVAILPDIETLYWLPCPVEGEAMPLEVGGEAKVLPHVFHITSSHYGGIYCAACYARKRGRTLPLPVRDPQGPLGTETSDERELASTPSSPPASPAPRGSHLSRTSDDALGHDEDQPRAPSPSASPASSEVPSFMAQPEVVPASAPAVAYVPSGSTVGAPPAAPSSEPPSPGPVSAALLKAHAGEGGSIDVDAEILEIAARIQDRFERAGGTPAPYLCGECGGGSQGSKCGHCGIYLCRAMGPCWDRHVERVHAPPSPPTPTEPTPPTRPAWHNDPPRPNRADFERAQWWEERAAVIAEGAKCSRELSEELAYKDMLAAFRRGEIW